MKKELAVLYNSLLESFHFNNEAKPARKDMNFKLMQEGMNHLFFVAQCTGDEEAMQSLASACDELHAGNIPEPLMHYGTEGAMCSRLINC